MCHLLVKAWVIQRELVSLLVEIVQRVADVPAAFVLVASVADERKRLAGNSSSWLD